MFRDLIFLLMNSILTNSAMWNSSVMAESVEMNWYELFYLKCIVDKSFSNLQTEPRNANKKLKVNRNRNPSEHVQVYCV